MVRSNPALSDTPAVRYDRLPWLPVPAINSASHHAVDGLEQVFAAIHAGASPRGPPARRHATV